MFDIKSAMVPGVARDTTATCKCSRENKRRGHRQVPLPRGEPTSTGAGAEGEENRLHTSAGVQQLETKPLAKRGRASETDPSPGQGCGVQGHSGLTAPPAKASPSYHSAGDAVGWAEHRCVCHGTGGNKPELLAQGRQRADEVKNWGAEGATGHHPWC